MALRPSKKMSVTVYQHSSDGVEEHRLELDADEFELFLESLNGEEKVVGVEELDGTRQAFRSSAVVRVVGRPA